MIAVCGEALIDFTLSEIGDERAYIPRPGGSPCNVAVGLARLGVPSAFIGRLSTDHFGETLRAYLMDSGVDLRWLSRGGEPTTLAFVIPRAGQAHDFAFYGVNTADQNLALSDLPRAFPDDVSALHFGSYSLMLGESAHACETLMRREHRRRFISLDPNVRPALFPDRSAYRRRIEALLEFAALVKVSAEDMRWLYPSESPSDVAHRWLDAGPALVVLTLGADGAIGITPKHSVHSPALPVSVADAVGAGDAFTAALLSHLYNGGYLSLAAVPTLTHHALTSALAHANLHAAIACARQGATAGSETPLRVILDKPNSGQETARE